jgi:hypothetical protein
VRKEAYKALACYPLDLIEKLQQAELDADQNAGGDLRDPDSALTATPADLSGYVRAVLCTGAAAAGSGEAPLVVPEPDASARREAEVLAVMALRHEHENRRRFLAISASSSSSAAAAAAAAIAGSSVAPGSQSSSAAGAAAAATAREAASVRHRLLQTLPAMLLRGQQAQAAPSLLLFTPPPPASVASSGHSSRGSKAEQQHLRKAQRAVSEGFRLRLREGLSRLRWSEWTHPGPAAHAWFGFFTRCLGGALP